MSKYFETVNFWLENLLDSVGNYTVINVAQEDMGKIIGRNGRVITSLRTLVSSIAKKEKKIVKIEVKEL